MPRILVIEDQQKLRRNLRELLEKEQYQVATAETGEEGLQIADNCTFDAIVLDLTLPGFDGLHVLENLRRDTNSTPVLILTARDSIDDRVAGLDAGADDYLVKPFSHAELLARVRVLLRRYKSDSQRMLRCGDVEVDVLTRKVVRNGYDIELSQREFELLEYLMRHKNSSVSREMLANDIWKEPHGIWTNAIDVCINALRRKLKAAGDQPVIITVRGVGYSIKGAE